MAGNNQNQSIISEDDSLLHAALKSRIERDSWHEYANTRKFNIGIRWIFGLLLAFFLVQFSVPLHYAMIWGIFMTLFMVMDYLAANHVMKNANDPIARRNLCIAEFIAVSSYAAIAPLGWFYGESAAKLCVLLFFSGALATHSSSTQKLPVIRALMLAPYYTLIPLLFAIDAFIAPPNDKMNAIYLAIVSLLGILYFTMVLRQSIKNSHAFEDAIFNSEIARLKAINANKAKSRFISAVSHDLRTPLSAIIGSARLLKNYEKDNESRELLSVLIQSGENMTNLLNEIIDTRILASGKVQIASKPFSPQIMLDACADLWERPIVQKNLEFICDYHHNLPECLIGDENAIKRIINCLLSEALKNTKQGWICLRGEHKDGNFIIEVCDSGNGFQQLNSIGNQSQSSNPNPEEYSIGLNNCNQLASLMNGKFEINNDSNSGSQVLLTIPAEISEFEIEAPASIKDFRALSSDTLEVLIADDNENARMILRRFLEALGANVTEANDGIGAVKMAQESQFHMIFLDVRMPQLDGIEACKQIRDTNGLNCDVPIFMISADATSARKQFGKRAGADGYITKPFGPKDIIGAVENQISQRISRVQ